MQRRGEVVVEERRRHVQAAPALGSPAGQHHRPRRPTGTQAGIVGQLVAISPPLSAVGWATLSSQSPPPPPPPPSQPPDRNPLIRSVHDSQSHSGPHTTTRSPAPGLPGRERGGPGEGVRPPPTPLPRWCSVFRGTEGAKENHFWSAPPKAPEKNLNGRRPGRKFGPIF